MILKNISFEDVYPIIIVFISVIGLLFLFMIFIILTNKYTLKKKKIDISDKKNIERETKIYQILYEKSNSTGLTLNELLLNLDINSDDSNVILDDLNHLIIKNIIEKIDNKYIIKRN